MNARNSSEMIAKRVLERLLPGAMLEYQVAQSNGEYDFVLHYPDGQEAAVEVTTAVDSSVLATCDAIYRRNGGPLIDAVRCRKTWIVSPHRGAQISELRTKIDEQLANLEAAGVDSYDWKTDRKIAPIPQVSFASVISAEGAKICIRSPVYGYAVGPTSASEAGEDEAWKSDNRTKLGAAGTSERHLAVYVDVRNGSAWTGLTAFDPPPTAPALPEEITALWLIGQGKNFNPAQPTNEFVVWRGNANTPWQKMLVTVESGFGATSTP